MWLLVVFAVPAGVSAASQPDAGRWTGPPASAPGARATVRFTVDPGTGLVQPVVRYRLRRCGGRGWSEAVALGLVAVRGGRFEVVSRHRARRARVRLRLVGRFDSKFQAHGTLAGRIAGRCRLGRLSWTAQQGGGSTGQSDDLDEIADEDLEDGEELDEDDFDEDGEPIEAEEPPPDGDDEP